MESSFYTYQVSNAQDPTPLRNNTMGCTEGLMCKKQRFLVAKWVPKVLAPRVMKSIQNSKQ